MLALITKLDCTNALLFHVEQWDGNVWEYRVMDGGEWSSARPVYGESVVIPVSERGEKVIAEWRVPGGPWKNPKPRQFGEAECDFEVTVLERIDFRGKVMTACSSVRGHPSVWELSMPEHAVAEEGPEIITVRGRSKSKGLGQVLREEGEFFCEGELVSVSNVSASQAALLPDDSTLPRAMEMEPAFFVKVGRLSDQEIELLKNEVNPPCPPQK